MTKPDQKQIDKAKQIFEATGFEGDLRVGLLSALNAGRILLRYINSLERDKNNEN